MMDPKEHLLFTLDGQRYGLSLAAVELVFRAVAVTPLPEMPATILGLVNVQGRIVPVFNLRKRCNLPPKEVEPTDQMILVRTRERVVALVADGGLGVVDCPPEAMVAAEQILPHLEGIEGVVKLADGLVLIQDIDSFLSLAEEEAIKASQDGALADG